MFYYYMSTILYCLPAVGDSGTVQKCTWYCYKTMNTPATC